MPNANSRSRVRWRSSKRSFRRRWPVYLVILVFCVTSVAIAIIVANNLEEGPKKAPATPIPKAIR